MAEKAKEADWRDEPCRGHVQIWIGKTVEAWLKKKARAERKPPGHVARILLEKAFEADAKVSTSS